VITQRTDIYQKENFSVSIENVSVPGYKSGSLQQKTRLWD